MFEKLGIVCVQSKVRNWYLIEVVLIIYLTDMTNMPKSKGPQDPLVLKIPWSTCSIGW